MDGHSPWSHYSGHKGGPLIVDKDEEESAERIVLSTDAGGKTSHLCAKKKVNLDRKLYAKIHSKWILNCETIKTSGRR